MRRVPLTCRRHTSRPKGTSLDEAKHHVPQSGTHRWKKHLLSQVLFSVNGVRKRGICVFGGGIRTNGNSVILPSMTAVILCLTAQLYFAPTPQSEYYWKKRFCRSTKDVFLLAIGYGKDAFAFCMDGFGLLKKCFAKQSYRFSSLFSFLSSLFTGKSRGGERREERRTKSEEWRAQKEKAAEATFSFWRRGRDSNPRALSRKLISSF